MPTIDDPLDDLVSGRATFRMMLIGVNTYQDNRLGALNFAIADCRGLYDALAVATASFPQRNKIVRYGATGLQPTLDKQSIYADLERLVAEAKPQDTVLFYFSGHGEVDAATQQLYLCLTETSLSNLPETGLSVQFLLRQLHQSKIGKQILVLDTCHSGDVNFLIGSKGADGSSHASESEKSDTFTPGLEEALKRHSHQHKNFYALLSCGAGQQSFEFADRRHGAFTHFLIRGLHGDAADYQGIIKVDSLYRYVRNETTSYVRRSMNAEQTPTRIVADNQEFVVGTKPATQPGLYPSDLPLTLETFNDRKRLFRDQITEDLRQRGVPDYTTLPTLQARLGIDNTVSTEIVAEVTGTFDNYRKRYKDEISRCLHQHGEVQQEHLLTIQSAMSYYLSEVIANDIIAEEKNRFDQKKQAYRTEASKHLYETGTLNTALLTPLQERLGLNATVIQQITSAVTADFDQRKQRYRNAIRDHLHEQGSLDPEVCQQWQETCNLGQAVISPILEELTNTFNVHKRSYQKVVSENLHQVGTLNVESLRMAQNVLTLSDQVVRSITAVEMEIFNQNKQTYQDAVAQSLHQQSQEQSEALQQLQADLGLGKAVVQTVTALQVQKFNEHKQTYRTAVSRSLHQYGKKPSESLQQLQNHLGLGHAVTEEMRFKETQKFDHHVQEYRTAIAQSLRQRGAKQVAPLQQLQNHLGLGDPVVQDITTEEIQQFKAQQRQVLNQRLFWLFKVTCILGVLTTGAVLTVQFILRNNLRTSPQSPQASLGVSSLVLPPPLSLHTPSSSNPMVELQVMNIMSNERSEATVSAVNYDMMLSKAFKERIPQRLTPGQSTVKTSETPIPFVIDYGFLQGCGTTFFCPNPSPMTKRQISASLASGLELKPDQQKQIERQMQSAGTNATRADVAAVLYESLVLTGQAAPLPSS